ncbi:MAG TPA: carbonic anhydrase [Vicinamibacteria bacterium]|nr:carbonic anhydrase [Vicinamibacteria bacterium]
MTETRYVSALAYEPARIYAAAVYCSDGRLGDHIDDFLHNGLRLPRYDRVACPGGPVALAGRLAAHWEARGVEEQLRFLVQVHEIRKVVLIAHVGCAYYSRKLLLPPEQVEPEQLEDLQKARWGVERLVPGIEVAAYLLRVAGTEVAFDAIVR